MIFTPENWKWSNQSILALNSWYPGCSQTSLSDYLPYCHLIKIKKKFFQLPSVKCFFVEFIKSSNKMALAVARNHFYLNQMALCTETFSHSQRRSVWTWKPINWYWWQWAGNFSHFKLFTDISPLEKQEQMGEIHHPLSSPPSALIHINKTVDPSSLP